MIHACILVLALLSTVSSSAGEALDIGEALADEAFWKSDAVLFVKRHHERGFKFTDETRLTADARLAGCVTCFGLPVFESRVSFAPAGGIARVELSLFNAGGAERVEEIKTEDGHRLRRIAHVDVEMSREEFFAALKTVRGRLTPVGAKPPAPVDERTRDARVNQASQSWPRTALPTEATLAWNYSQNGKDPTSFEPGFIRLAVDGPANLDAKSPSRAGRGAGKTAKGAKKIVENVVKDPRGDVFIDNIPMIDQGAKGYCAVAAAERVMRYFGLDVDEHEIGEAADTRAEGGTSTKAMREAIEAIGKRHGLATKVLYGDFDEGVGKRIDNLAKEVANYNKTAKKLKRKAITEDMYVTREGNRVSYDIAAVDAAMDAEVLKEMKTNGSQKSKFTKFKDNIRQNVNAGIPLLWGVMLGTYPEDDLPQARGGHMRLIIGYNDKKSELLYSDTWGKGHELKRMPVGWAWTITRSVMVMSPRR